MSTKNQPGEFDCLAKIEPDEPYFVLRANDYSAWNLVHMWSLTRSADIARGFKPASDAEQAKEALECAKAMRAWYEAKHPSGPVHLQVVEPRTEAQPTGEAS
jgi:hypothetical protein